MLKSTTCSVIKFILICSLLGPSIDALISFSSKTEKVYVIDFNEEENNESEKKFDEKELFFQTQLTTYSLFSIQKNILQVSNLLLNSQFNSEIVPPPPKYSL